MITCLLLYVTVCYDVARRCVSERILLNSYYKPLPYHKKFPSWHAVCLTTAIPTLAICGKLCQPGNQENRIARQEWMQLPLSCPWKTDNEHSVSNEQNYYVCFHLHGKIQIVSVTITGTNWCFVAKSFESTLWASWRLMENTAKLFHVSGSSEGGAHFQPQSQTETGKCAARKYVFWSPVEADYFKVGQLSRCPLTVRN